MKKIFIALLGCFALIPGVSGNVFAVWPSAASYQNESKSPSRQDLSVTERLADDVRRLDDVLKKLKDDQEELKQAREKTRADAGPTPSRSGE